MTSSSATTAACRASWYQRLFANALAKEQIRRQPDYAARKRALLGDLRGELLEIGPGTGPNLAYYASDVRWRGVEPNPAMIPYLHHEARRLGLAIRVDVGRAEQLDAADTSVDAVVGTLVLCSVADPRRALQEIVRVLKPGGRFVFLEHVAAPRASGLRRFQRLVRPLWKPLTDGCRPDQETWELITQAGFASVQLEHFRLDVPIVGPHIAGYALKAPDRL